MKKKEVNKNANILNIEEKGNRFNKIISDFIMDIFQHYFGAKGGKALLYSIIAICLGRGLIGKLLFGESFLYAFFYPLIIIAIVSVIYLPLRLISFKSPKVAEILTGIITVVCLIFLASVLLLLIISILNSIFHFWF